MNQILSTSMPMENNKKNTKNKKNRQPIAIGSILKFFGMVILIFGVFIIGIGGYTIYKNQIVQQQNLEPTIAIENKTDTVILLKVTHEKKIAKVEYGWTNGTSTPKDNFGDDHINTSKNLPIQAASGKTDTSTYYI